jgi:molybdate transport system substrate-binding protein
MSHTIEVLKQSFHKQHPQTKMIVSLGSSGKMTAQITQGAPYQIFMSADMRFPKRLYDEGLAITKPVIYAWGALAILSRNKQNFTEGIHMIENKNIHTIVIANPKTAPYGKAAMEALNHGGIYGKVASKLVYSESIAHAISYTVHVADIGFVAKSSLFDPKMKKFYKDMHWIEVNPTFYAPIEQGIVILKNGLDSEEVRAFYDFIFSKEAKKILTNFGYRTL